MEATNSVPAINRHTRLATYLSAARNLQAAARSHDGVDNAAAFVYAFRLATLLVRLRQQHPDFALRTTADDAYVRDASEDVMSMLDTLRESLLATEGAGPSSPSRAAPPSPSSLALPSAFPVPPSTFPVPPAPPGPTAPTAPPTDTHPPPAAVAAVPLTESAPPSAAPTPPLLPPPTASPALPPPPPSGPAYPPITAGRAFFADAPPPAPSPPPRPLRTVVLPRDVVARFAALAEPNTFLDERGVETCGVLAGRPLAPGAGGGIVVTHIIVPDQLAGSDSCEMIGEDVVLEFCLEHGLLAAGWIHTHPSQSCFMSSMDLHTHYSFQATLPEAIAIVVAPRDARVPWSAFRLTTDESGGGGGFALIQACEVRGRMGCCLGTRLESDLGDGALEPAFPHRQR